MGEKNLYEEHYFKGNLHTSASIERASLSFKPIVYSFIKRLKPSRVLDIGCAKGFLVFLFHSFGVESYGVDISSYAIGRAPEEIKKNLFVLDVEEDNLPFPDDYFDLLMMVEVLEHLHFSSVNHLLKEIKRVLRPNGYICLTLPTPGEEKKDITHINLRPKYFWINFFQENNFILASSQKRLLKKESQKYIWGNKRYFANLYRKLLKDEPPSSRLGKLLAEKKGGNIIREVFWLSNYFFFRNKNYFDNKMMLFKKL